MMGREAFLMKPKHRCHLSQWWEWVYDLQSWKERRLLCLSMFIQIYKCTLVVKNGGRKRFSYKTKASISFTLMRRMSLWFTIMKRKEIIMWIRVYPNWKMNLDSKKWWVECFLRNQNINVIYPNTANEYLMPNHEKKRDCYVNPCLS